MNSKKNAEFYSLCSCFDSNPYHIGCMSRRIKDQCFSISNDERIWFFNVQRATCDLCKERIPGIVNGNSIFGFDIDYRKNFIVFEVLNEFAKIRNLLIIYIDAEKWSFTVGSHENCDISFSSKYVSSQHATFKVKDNQLYICDHVSTYGTGILRDQAKINENELHRYFLGPFLFHISSSLDVYSKYFFRKVSPNFSKLAEPSHEDLSKQQPQEEVACSYNSLEDAFYLPKTKLKIQTSSDMFVEIDSVKNQFEKSSFNSERNKNL